MTHQCCPACRLRLPTVVWAYPLEYNSADTAGQVAGSPYRFTTLAGPSHLFFLLQGYAVLDGATMPVVGDPETANDTFLGWTGACSGTSLECVAVSAEGTDSRPEHRATIVAVMPRTSRPGLVPGRLRPPPGSVWIATSTLRPPRRA